MDDSRRTIGLPASLTNGRLEGIGIPDVLWNVCSRRTTGVLSVVSRGTTKKIFIDAGQIVFAASSDPNDRLGVALLRDGMITLDQLELAVLRLPSGKRLGTLLVEAGHLTPDGLVRGVIGQVRQIVLGLFTLEEGVYRFDEGPLPSEEVITLGMKTAEILLQGVRQIRSFTRIRRSVGSAHTRSRLDPNWEQILDGLDVRDGERMLLQRIGEAGARGVTVESLCHEVFLSNFEIYRALWAYKVLGVVHEVARDGDYPATPGFEGWLDRVGLPELLVRLCRDGETGVLHVSRGAIERTFHIKEGVCIFATSSSIDDGLVAHLLRRGVISLQNCEETARRLLSNKRVGTILLEMGVIDENDLRATMREQLLEIVFDTFRWESGDFRFVSGELPTIEQITLDRTVEDLVFDGVRRVTSWSRVREGCGGPGTRLVLLPEYLAVLDRMSVGADEWELISTLRTPKTVQEACRESILGGFRSCQILWGLRLLGAITVVPAEEVVEQAPNDPVAEAAVEPAPETEAASDPEEPVDGEPEAVDEPAPAIVAEHDPVPVSPVEEPTEISATWELIGERHPDDRPTLPPAVLTDAEEEAEIVSAEESASEPSAGATALPVEEPVSEEAEPAAAPVLEDEALDADRTIRIPREEIEAALRESAREIVPDRVPAPPVEPPAARQPPRPAEPPWTPPAGLDGCIARFNARHVVLFKALRTEVGAGAANFVRSCRASLGAQAILFATAELRSDGSWDPSELRKSVIEHRIANAEVGFQQLLAQEVEMLRLHLGASRVGALVAQLAAIS